MKEYFEDLTKRQQKLFEAFLFLAKLCVAGLIFQTILFIYPSTLYLQRLQAQLSATVLNLVSTGFEASTIKIFSPETVYIITQDCLGWKSMAMFTALVFSAENIRDNVKSILAGLAAIFVANNLRIVSTVLLSEYGVLSFEVVHGILWKWSLTFFVLIIWLTWLKRKSVRKRLEEA
ncbi:MAG: exosortase/archaeosortase family protein [Candidatus Nanohalobium sp.]